MTEKSQKYLTLLKEIQEKELFQVLIHQMNKDLNLSGIRDQIDLNIKTNELLTELSKIVFILLKDPKQGIQNYLYRVDVPENIFNKILDPDLKIRALKISMMILIKECQKVWFRSKNL